MTAPQRCRRHTAATPADLQCDADDLHWDSSHSEIFCYLPAGHAGAHWDCVDGHWRMGEDGRAVFLPPCAPALDGPIARGLVP